MSDERYFYLGTKRGARGSDPVSPGQMSVSDFIRPKAINPDRCFLRKQMTRLGRCFVALKESAQSIT